MPKRERRTCRDCGRWARYELRVLPSPFGAAKGSGLRYYCDGCLIERVLLLKKGLDALYRRTIKDTKRKSK